MIEKYFTNTVSRVEGISLKDLEADVDARHGAAFDPLGLENDLTLELSLIHISTQHGPIKEMQDVNY